MIPQTNFDIFLLVQYISTLVLTVYFLRYVLTFFLPEEFRDYFDYYLIWLRNRPIRYAEMYFPNTKNFESAWLTRLVIPMLFLVPISIYLDLFLINYVYGRYLLLGYFFFLIQLYLLFNIVPSLDDFELLFLADGLSKIIFALKVLVILFTYPFLTPLTVSLIIVFPVSDMIDINNYYMNDEGMENISHPSWDY